MTTANPLVSVLIPTCNGGDWVADTLGCLGSAAGDLSWEAIVADNASSDETVAVCAKTPGVKVISHPANLGFSKAVNRAAALSKGRLLVVINQDLFLRPGSIHFVADFLSSKAAVIGGGLASADGTTQPSCGPFPSLAGTLWRLALPRSRRKYYLRPPASTLPARADWVTGAFMAFHREIFEAVGGFDEGFFMYYEDVDFCRRVHDKGFPVFYLPTAEAVHVAPYAERKGAPDWLNQEIRISQMRYFDKHRPRWEAATIWGLNRAYFAARGWSWPPVGRAAAAQ